MRGLPVETMQAAIGATEADFSAAGTHAGPPGSGETWNVYEAEVSGRGTAWVYLDKDKRVRRVDNFSAAPLQPPESADEAVAVAGDYLMKVGGPSTDGLNLRPTAGGDSKGRPAAVVWQKRQGLVWVPSGVTVQVARDGTVVGYQWIETPVTVSLEPAVTAAKAAASVRRDLTLGGIRKKSTVLEVLQIDPEGDGATTQYLVWNVALSLTGYSGPPGALAVVDALTGKVLAAERLVP